MIEVDVLDRESVNCSDHGPCYSDEGASVWELGRCPTPDLASPGFPQGKVSRDSAVMEGSSAWTTPIHSGFTTTKSGMGQSESITLNCCLYHCSLTVETRIPSSLVDYAPCVSQTDTCNLYIFSFRKIKN
jgi:hypothetical protein